VPLRERVEALPGMGTLLPALDGLEPAYLVGGAVRDLLLGGPSVDLDVAVEGDALATAEEVARRLQGTVRAHERFGTATVSTGDLTVDLASTRSETYERPGALPDVAPAGLAEDLGRRDFTINAMAVALTGPDAGELTDPHGGAADLEAGTVRVLHDASFVDDPTRLLRAVRYETRLGFALDPETERLAREGAGGLAEVSGARVRDELLDLLAEEEAPAAVDRLHELGIAPALHPALRAQGELVAAAQLGSAETGADRVLSGLAALASGGAGDLVERLGLGAGERDRTLRAAERGPGLAEELAGSRRPSELHALLDPEPPEALALALAFGAPAEPVLEFVAGLRHARLDIGGEDLKAEGVAESPAIGAALAETLRRKLDGEISTREEQLRTALALVREAS
jgi:tRNA nucleotidyltransferase (CCA-adding enzyme)